MSISRILTNPILEEAISYVRRYNQIESLIEYQELDSKFKNFLRQLNPLIPTIDISLSYGGSLPPGRYKRWCVLKDFENQEFVGLLVNDDEFIKYKGFVDCKKHRSLMHSSTQVNDIGKSMMVWSYLTPHVPRITGFTYTLPKDFKEPFPIKMFLTEKIHVMADTHTQSLLPETQYKQMFLQILLAKVTEDILGMKEDELWAKRNWGWICVNKTYLMDYSLIAARLNLHNISLTLTDKSYLFVQLDLPRIEEITSMKYDDMIFNYDESTQVISTNQSLREINPYLWCCMETPPFAQWRSIWQECLIERHANVFHVLRRFLLEMKLEGLKVIDEKS
jgi:hypothetical protein